MREKYEGKTVKIFAPFRGRFLSHLKVIEVIGNNILYGIIPNTDLYTSYALSDGIRVEICDLKEEVQDEQ